MKIAAATQADGDAAAASIKEITAEPEIGMVYDGKVVKTTDFGAFVQILPGTDGLVHISQLAHQRVRSVTDVVREGDTIRVKVLEIDKNGKIRLSRKAVLERKDGSARK